jgi:hypothetical protein
MMIDAIVAWDDEDDPRGNVQHIAINHVTVEEVEEVLGDPGGVDRPGRRTGRREWQARTAGGRPLVVVYETLQEDPWVIYVVTAYEPTPLGG